MQFKIINIASTHITIKEDESSGIREKVLLSGGFTIAPILNAQIRDLERNGAIRITEIDEPLVTACYKPDDSDDVGEAEIKDEGE